MKGSIRRLLFVVGTLFLAATAYAYFRRGDGNGNEYLTEPVTRGPVVSTVTASGALNPVTSVQVGTYVSGPIQAIYADFNSKVIKGQLVARIDPAPFLVKVASAEAGVATARARVAKDEADLRLKKLTLERNRTLLDKKFISQNDLDTAQSNYEQSIAQLALDSAAIQQSQADLDAARISLGYTDIKSPVDGVVVSRSVDVGQTVAASFQTPTLFLIAQDLTKMQVDANVSESDIGMVTVDQSVAFQVDAYPDRDFRGKVVQVRNAPLNLQNVITYTVVVAVENPKLELRPGMTATITITTAEASNALRIPIRALRFRPERERTPGPDVAASPRPREPRRGERSPAVHVMLPDATLKQAKVETGVMNESYAELVSGDLHEGDLVVIGTKRTEAAAGAQSQQPPSFLGGGSGGRRY